MCRTVVLNFLVLDYIMDLRPTSRFLFILYLREIKWVQLDMDCPFQGLLYRLSVLWIIYVKLRLPFIEVWNKPGNYVYMLHIFF